MSKLNPRFLKNRRVHLELSQDEVAEYVGVSRSAISRWESGEIKNMGVDKLKKISEILRFNPLTLIDDEVHSGSQSKEGIPLIGKIAAGTPILAEENIQQYIKPDSLFYSDFCISIKGDSMEEAGIDDGDIVFIRQQSVLENGEIGAMLVDNEATLKRFYMQDGTVVLQPANSEYKPLIYTGGDVRILGKLVATLKIGNE